MPRRTGGFIGHRGLQAPDPPTAVTPTVGDKKISVAFTAPSDVGDDAITGFNVQSSNGDGTISAISNASYDSKSFDVSQDDQTRNLTFKPDGTKMYVTGMTGDSVYQYALSTAYDVSTASYENKSFDTSSQEANPFGIAFNDDGTSMYTVGYSNDTVYQYTLSSAYDVSTASYASKSLDVSSQDTTPLGVTFKPDGTSMYVMGADVPQSVYQYTLSTAFDVSTGSFASKSLNISSFETNGWGFQFNADGTKCFVAGNYSDKVHQFSLSTAYDVSTASSDGVSFSFASQDANPNGLAFSTDRSKMYVLGTDDFVYQYTTNLDSYASASPVVVLGLTNDTAYTFKAFAINDYGTSAPSDVSPSATPEPAARALFFGGYTSAVVNTIDFVEIPTTGNASDFGDLTVARIGAGATSSSTRGVCMGGFASGTNDTIDYVTMASEGNATDFGNLVSNNEEASACGSDTRGIMAGGASKTSTIQYITIASTGNASSFGSLVAGKQTPTALSSTTRSCIAGGNSSNGNYTNEIDYITTASTSNASDFGDLTQGRQGLAGAANNTRGVMGGGALSGDSDLNTIDYITIASTGNASDFGDLVNGGDTRFGSAASNSTRALLDCGGLSNNKMEYVTIASTGNGTDFGNLTTQRRQYDNGASNGHGGIAA